MQVLFATLPYKRTSAIAAAHMKFFGLQNKVDWEAIPSIMIPLLGVL
jgi:hypothetical protein